MRGIVKYLKGAAGPLALCLLLLGGQAACELASPALLARLVEEGVRGEAVDAGAPEAVSLQGMTLLQTFLTETDREALGGQYFTFAPGSTEAQRLSERYPLLRERTVCVVREGLTEEESARLDEIYAKAADALDRYLARAAETGELQETARRFARERQRAPGEFRSNVRDFTKEESSLPQGVIGKIPDDALFTMPSSEEEGTAASAPPGEEPEVSAPEGSETPEPEEPEDFLDVDLSAGLAGLDAEQLYTLLPLMGQGVQADAAQADPDRGQEAAATLKGLLYRELGVSVRSGSGGLWPGLLLLLGIGLLGLALAAASWLVISRTAAGIGRRMRRALAASGQTVTGEARRAERLVRRGLRGLCYAPVVFLGSGALGAAYRVTGQGLGALALGALLGLGLTALALIRPRRLEPPGAGLAALERKLGPLEGLPAALLIPAGLLGMHGVCLIFCRTNREVVRQAVLPVGDRMAALEYAAMMILAGGLAAWALWERKQEGRRAP